MNPSVSTSHHLPPIFRRSEADARSPLADRAQGNPGSAVGVQWFAIFLQAFLNIRVLYTLATDSVARNQVQLVGLVCVSLVFGVLGVNSGIFAATSFQQAIGAGWLLISIVDVLWLMYFSSESDAVFVGMFDVGSRTTFARGGSFASAGAARGGNGQSVRGSGQMSTGGAAISYSGAYSGMGGLKSVGSVGGGQSMHQSDHHHQVNMNGGGGVQRSPTIGGESLMDGQGQGQEYALKARALYSYTASPDDPNEISFAKGEILDIVDNSGKWWQARKADGITRGIVPSNYLVLC